MDHALVVRGITTVFNTDYMTDFVFHLNGEIQVLLFFLPFSNALPPLSFMQGCVYWSLNHCTRDS